MAMERTWLIVAFLLGGVLDTSAYDSSVGRMMAYLEKAIYCGEDQFSSWNVGDACTHGPVVDDSKLLFVKSHVTDAAAGVGFMTEPNGCFVAMRGTLTPTGAMFDAMFWLSNFSRKSCPNCMVDFGFSSNYESIKPEIFRALEDFDCKSRPLFLVGHSLGAAGLHYLLFDALDLGYTVKHSYALESPRPGDENFARALQEKAKGVDAWRVAHYQDLVVHLPPASVLSYRHALPEIYYTSREGSEYRNCGVEDDNCSNQWVFPWDLAFDDHMWYQKMNPCACTRSGKSDCTKVADAKVRKLLMV